ncbi:MAG: hypothetical protein OXE99_06360 [Cellvibrionales bacterium]|nr:hypothetical protein [Cellvibrionales bacterium]
MKFLAVLQPKLMLLLILPLLIQCSNTRIVQLWQSPTFKKKQFDQVLVMGVSPSQVNREAFEQTFCYELIQSGIKATPSFEALGDDYLNREKVKAYTARNNIRYVVVAYQVGIDINTNEVTSEDSVYISDSNPPAEPAMLHDIPTLDSFWSPGAFITTKQPSYNNLTVKAKMRTNVFKVNGNKKVWSAESVAFDPDSLTEVSRETARLLLKNMK